MFTSFAHRFAALLVLLLVSNALAPALAAPASPTTVSTSIPNQYRTVLFTGWMGYCNRYERMQKAMVVSAAKPQVKAFTCNLGVGGAPIPFGIATTLTLTLDGTPVASTAVKATDTSVTFNVDINAVTENWYRASITGLDDSWSVLDYGVYVLKGAVAKPHSVMPVITASHELVAEGDGRYQQAWVPTKFEPVTVPYPARTFPPFSTLPTRKNLVMTSLAVPRPDDLYRPAITKEGVWTTANQQNYFFSTFEQANPILPMLDGPRGRGSIIAPVHLEVGTAAPNGVLRGNVYFIESWRIGKVTPDGTVVTLAGHRHKDMASYFADPTSAELVGDWSSIPAERRGFAQPWGMAWDARTLGINETAAPIPTEGNEKPHIFGPTLYVSDTYRNRVVKIQYSATAHGVPPKVTEFATGLNEPWDVVAVGVKLYVSDRKNHAIKVFDMDTGALVKSIPVLQPEGLALMDGWLYYGSLLTKSIRKINLATGENVLIADPTVAAAKFSYHIDDNSRYMKIAVSDGSFGPRGMVAYTTWSNRNFGYPNLIDGTTGAAIDFINVKGGETFRGTNPLGLASYSTAVGIGAGRMLFGTAEEGLHVVSQALPTDPVIDMKKYTAGMDQWQAKGYNLTHGPAGYGYYGLPMPWGDTPEIDYFLKANLHGGGIPGGGGPPPNTPDVTASPSTAAFGNITIGQTSASKTIVISNTGAAAATDMAYPAAPAKFGKSGTCGGATLNAGATCTIVFTYTPTSAVTDSTTYTITGGGATMSIGLSGTGVPTGTASLSASPTALSFGSVTAGQSSGARSVTITNTGTAAASGLAMANANAAEFVVSANTCGTSLASGATCTLNVTYRPGGTGADTANLTFTFSGGSPAQVAMSGAGVAPATPNVSASPLSLAFGSVTVGQTSGPQAIIVSNTGTGNATNMVYPSTPANFNRSGTCSGATLSAGATCTVVFTFSPTAAADTNATYTITGGGRTMAIAMSGTGTESATPSLSATPSSLSFGTVAPGTSSTQQSITLTNYGAAAATGLSLTNTNSLEFPVSGHTCGTTLGPGATCQLLVAYAPSGAGFDNASLVWSYGSGSLTVPMVGMSEDLGVSPPPPPVLGKLTITGSLSFSSVMLGLASSPSTVTVTNNGDATVAVAAINSSNAGEFSISGSTCKSIAAGASCTFNVTFSPFYIGPRTATITVTSNAPDSPQTVQVAGAGQSGAPAPPPPPPGAAAAIEYYHAGFDHYFISASADEIGKLDAGTFAGWVRTGRQFNVFGAPATGLRTACRFFSTAFGPRSSHFYTPDAPECATVRGNPDWQFEGDVFYTMTPAVDGTCATGTKPVYRMYNNGQGGAPNHRYTTEPSVRALMLAQGWIAEGYGAVGVIMCAPQ